MSRKALTCRLCGAARVTYSTRPLCREHYDEHQRNQNQPKKIGRPVLRHCRFCDRPREELQGKIQELDAERAENATLRSKIEGLGYWVDGVEAEVASRFKGCRTVNEAWCAYDSMEGRALLAEEQRDAAQAEAAQLRAERETLLADAERYRHIRTVGRVDVTTGWAKRVYHHIRYAQHFVPVKLEGITNDQARFDAVIDAARTAKERG